MRKILSWFTYRKPIVNYFDYSLIKLSGESYFLFTWDFNFINSFSIVGTRFKSKSKKGSGYVQVPKNHNRIKIKLNNFWHSHVFINELKTITVSIEDLPIIHKTFQIRPKPKYLGFTFYNIKLKLNRQNVQVRNLKISIKPFQLK